MNISALASGSSGNCFLVNNVLVDAGLSCKQIIERLEKIKKDPKNIKAIFITHEHIDHTRGIDVLARNFQIPVYATSGTIKNSFLCSQEDLIQPIKNDETFKLEGMEIRAFSKSHDSNNPISITFKQEKTLSIITDIGYACKNVQEAVHDSDFLVMESNHDLKMLANGPYPEFLKQRIASNLGHISNLHSALCVLEHAPARLKHVMLAHLSKINNTPELALSTYKNLIKERYDLKPKISVSHHEIPSPLFKI